MDGSDRADNFPDTGGGRPTGAAPGAGYRATVVSVGDGDTLRVSTGSKPITIRLACIDAPETAQSPYGQQSRPTCSSAYPVAGR